MPDKIYKPHKHRDVEKNINLTRKHPPCIDIGNDGRYYELHTDIEFGTKSIPGLGGKHQIFARPENQIDKDICKYQGWKTEIQ
ncbi:hypothetical protein OAG24_00665 [bacterium]|nr:hypothetical protein [bacterium]